MTQRDFESALRENRFLSTAGSGVGFPTFNATFPGKDELRRSQSHTITETSSFQPGSIHVSTSPQGVRPLSHRKLQPNIPAGVQLTRTSSLSPPQGRPPGKSSNILTTIGQPIPGPTIVGPPKYGSSIQSGPILSRVIVGLPPSPTHMIHQLPVQNITRTEVIKESITDQTQINRLQTANRTLIQNYTNLYSKYKEIEGSSSKQQVTTSVDNINEVQLVRTLRSRVEQICDFELETALSRLRSATPRVTVLQTRTFM